MKTRETAGGSFQASGAYSWIEAEMTDSSMARVYVTLTFQSGDEIPGTCSATQVEELMITHQGELRNTWAACDGPLLIYRKN